MTFNLIRIVFPNGIKHKSEKFVVVSQIVAAFITNIMLLVFGMSVGYPTILIPSLSKKDNEDGLYLDTEQISWIGSINLLSLPLGCILSGMIAYAIGPKITMQITSILMVVCWIAFAFCSEIWHIYLALAVNGFAAGLCESPVLTYIAEIAQPHLRGVLMSTSTSAITLGVFAEFLLGSVFDWRTVGLYSTIPPVMYFLFSFLIPESPYWLALKNNALKGKTSLARLRGWSLIEDIEKEFQEIAANNTSTNHSKCSINFSDYMKLQFIRPYLLICFLFLIYNFTGLYTIQVYAVSIFETLQVPLNEYDATVILGISQFVGCVTCAVLISYIGKRLLTFISMVIAALSIIIVASFAYATNIKYLYLHNEMTDNVLSNYKWIPLVFMLSAVFTMNSGIRTLPWNLSVEVFTTKTRAVATGTLGAVFYFISFGCNKAFLTTVQSLTLPGVFWLYGCVGLISVVILYFCLPETEGKYLQEVTDHFAGVRKLDNKVGQKYR